MWLDPLTTGIAAAELGHKGWEMLPTVQKLWKREVDRFRRGSLTIPVFGAGGVGKTTAGMILTGELNPFTGPTAYRESLVTEEMKLPLNVKLPLRTPKDIGGVPCRLLIAPGQERRVVQTWPRLIRTLLTQDRIGIINVVCYGYHSLAEAS